jgi:hypothetical protein
MLTEAAFKSIVRIGSTCDPSYRSALVSSRVIADAHTAQLTGPTVLWDAGTRPSRHSKGSAFDGKRTAAAERREHGNTYSPTADRAVSVEQFHGRLWPNNATILSGIEWLWSTTNDMAPAHLATRSTAPTDPATSHLAMTGTAPTDPNTTNLATIGWLLRLR